MDSYYIRNRGTGKLELHFGKSDYDALTDAQRFEIKANFLWGRRSGCWISRCKEPNLWRAERVAQSIGLEDGGEQGERLTFAEQQERKAARAEHRAERFEIKADAACAKGEALQKPIIGRQGDTTFFTQPNLNTSAGRTFTRQRDKMLAAFEKGFDEFNKSEYYRQRAQAARNTAERPEMRDRAFLNRRIEECESNLRKLKKSIAEYEAKLPDAQAGTLRNYRGGMVSVDTLQNQIDRWADRMEQELDKLGYYQDAMDALGGVSFSRETIKPGYIVRIGRYKNSPLKVLSCGPKNFTGEFDDGFALKYPYAEITEIVRAEEEKPEAQPFMVGETFHVRGKSYIIVKATAKTVTYKSESGEMARTTPKYVPIPAQKKSMWRIVIGSGCLCECFYR